MKTMNTMNSRLLSLALVAVGAGTMPACELYDALLDLQSASTGEASLEEIDLLEQAEVPCGPGAEVDMVYRVRAIEMSTGASNENGEGTCSGRVKFSDDLSPTGTWSQSHYTDDLRLAFEPETDINGGTWDLDCGRVHCGTITDGAGVVDEDSGCTIVAFCDADTGLARPVGFTW